MKHYYINNNALPTGVHEMHTEGCTYLPTEKTYLGNFSTCEEAVEKAKTVYDKINGCKVCMQSCHKSEIVNN